MAAVAGVVLVLAVLALVFLASSIKIVQEYERGVIFRLGRCVGAKGPGLFFVWPILDRIVRVNLQIVAVPVASQAVITKDNVTSTVDAVAYFQVVDPAASVIKIRDWYTSSQLVAQTTLRSIVGRHELDQLLSERERIDGELQIALDADRAVGRQGAPGRDPRRRPARADAAGHGPPGRGRAGAAGQDHRRRGRAPGLPEAGRGGHRAQRPAPSSCASCRRWWRSRPRTARRSSSRSRWSSSRRSRCWPPIGSPAG